MNITSTTTTTTEATISLDTPLHAGLHDRQMRLQIGADDPLILTFPRLEGLREFTAYLTSMGAQWDTKINPPKVEPEPAPEAGAETPKVGLEADCEWCHKKPEDHAERCTMPAETAEADHEPTREVQDGEQSQHLGSHAATYRDALLTAQDLAITGGDVRAWCAYDLPKILKEQDQ